MQIISQLIGGFIACLCVYGVYKEQLVAITAGMRLAGEGAAVFSPSGVSPGFYRIPTRFPVLTHDFTCSRPASSPSSLAPPKATVTSSSTSVRVHPCS